MFLLSHIDRFFTKYFLTSEGELKNLIAPWYFKGFRMWGKTKSIWD